jgi:hypothetical protein
VDVKRRTLLGAVPICAGFSWMLQTSAAFAARPLSVRDCGAKGDGESDDSEAFKTALATSSLVSVPPGRYVVGDLIAQSNQLIQGAGDSSTLIQKPSSQYLLSINPQRSGTAHVEENTHDIQIEDLSFSGQVRELGFAEHCHLLNINACTRLKINRCSFRGFRGDAIYLGSSNVAGVERHNRDIRIRGCTFDGTNADNRNAVSVIDCDGLSIIECSFENCSRADMPGAIDIEPNQFPFHRINRVIIANNRIARCSGGVGNICLVFSRSRMQHPPTDITIENNVIDGNSLSNGLSLLGAERTGFAASGITIRGNTIKNTRSPLLLERLGDVNVDKNIFESSQLSGLISPTRSSTGTGIRIYGNTFKSLGLKSGIGLRALGCCALDIEKNLFHDCGYAERPNGVALRLEDRGRLPEVRGNQFLSSVGFHRTAIHLAGFNKTAYDSLLRGNSFANNIRPLR